MVSFARASRRGSSSAQATTLGAYVLHPYVLGDAAAYLRLLGLARKTAPRLSLSLFLSLSLSLSLDPAE